MDELMHRQMEQQFQNLKEEPLQRYTDTFVDEEIHKHRQAQQQPVFRQSFAVDPAVTVPSMEARSQKKLGRFEKKKQEKQVKEKRLKKQAADEAVIRQYRELTQQPRTDENAEQQQMNETAMHFVQTTVPELMGVKTDGAMFDLANMMESQLELVKLWENLMLASRVLEAAPPPVALQAVEEGQLRYIRDMLPLAAPLGTLVVALMDCEDGTIPLAKQNAHLAEANEPFQAALGTVRRANAVYVAGRVRGIEADEMDGVLKQAQKRQEKLMRENTAYRGMANAPYLEAHMARMARCEALGQGVLSHPEAGVATMNMKTELQRLAAAGGQLDIRRTALAEGIRKMRATHAEGDPDLAMAEAALAGYQQRMTVLEERMQAIENAMEYLYDGKQLSRRGYDVLRQSGYDMGRVDAAD